MLQRYVSPELTHFVAARLRSNEDAQYKTLQDILRSGLISSAPSQKGFGYGLSPLANDLGDSLSGPMVCFCDIPVEDLHVHSTKYGRFGLAFRKELLVQKGATPVFYVPNDAPTLPMLGHIFHFDRPLEDRRKDWTTPSRVMCGPHRRRDLFEVWKYAATQVARVRGGPGGQQSTAYEFMQGAWWSDFLEFFSLYVFGYVKYMDVGLAEDDIRNFYMEREWRVLHEVRFTLDDVSRVLIPEAYARTFRLDFPEYFGQLSFIE
jgi:hypothetical protein